MTRNVSLLEHIRDVFVFLDSEPLSKHVLNTALDALGCRPM